MTEKTPPHSIERLLAVMAQLRAPEGGCPWDIEQDFKTIAPYTVEEAYEVADAIERGDMGDLKSELGDLLFQVVYHAQMGSELAGKDGAFNFTDVAAAITEKMIARHPHVFSDAEERSADEQTVSWESQKAAERAARGENALLDGVPVGLPAMTRAVKLQSRAARVGFDWENPQDVVAKIAEEAGELAEAISAKNTDAIEDEYGDLLFSLANLSRHLSLDPETALRRTNAKFMRRFQFIEAAFEKRGVALKDASLEEMEVAWELAKAEEI